MLSLPREGSNMIHGFQNKFEGRMIQGTRTSNKPNEQLEYTK